MREPRWLKVARPAVLTLLLAFTLTPIYVMVSSSVKPLVDVQDAHALSEALHRLLTDTEFAERIGRAARDATVRDYDPQRVVESHLRPVLEGLPVNHGSQRTNNRWA